MAKYKIAFEINIKHAFTLAIIFSVYNEITWCLILSRAQMTKYRLGLSWTNLASPLVNSLLELEAASKVGFSQIVIKGDFFLKELAFSKSPFFYQSEDLTVIPILDLGGREGRRDICRGVPVKKITLQIVEISNLHLKHQRSRRFLQNA